MYNKPDAYIIGGSTKGITIEQLQNFGIVDATTAEQSPLGIQAAYSEVGWLKRCCDIHARTLASMPWAIYRQGATDPLFRDDEESPAAFDWLDMFDYLYRADVSLLNVGAAYALIEQPKNLFWFDPTTIEPVKTAQGITSYKRRVNTDTVIIPAELMLAVFAPDIYVEQGPGAADGVATVLQAQVLLDMANYSSSQLRTGLVKKTVFVAPPGVAPPNETERTRIKHMLMRFFLGTKGTPPEVLTGGIEPKEIGASLADLHDNAITQDAKETIASSLGVPHSLIMSNAANFATAQADQFNFYMTTIIPQAKLIATAMNRQLFNPMGYRLAFEPRRLEVMQSYMLDQAETVKELTGIPPMLFNEGRRILELPELTDAEINEHIELIQSAVGTAEFVDTEKAGSDNFNKSRDIRNWQRVIKRKGRSADFRPDALSEYETLVIKERLASGFSIEDSFKEPLSDF